MDIHARIRKLNLSAPDGEPGDRELLAGVGDLPGFLRALLVADGTVTALLAAYFNEEIRISLTSQCAIELADAVPALHLAAGDEGFVREVSLKGAGSGAQYATAFSLLNRSNLAPALFEELISEHVGMGEVLRNSGRGSYRKVLSVSQESPAVVCRVYTVYLDGLPTILINESFNRTMF